MSLTAFVMYCLSNIAAFLLFRLFQLPQKRSRSEEDSDGIVVRRQRFRRQPSLFTLLGISAENSRPFSSIDDHFHSFAEVSEACKRAGLERCGLIIGVDFTASNEWQGRKSFSGNCLHKVIHGKIYNPYQKVISIIGQTLAPFDDDNLIPSFGFGDTRSMGEKVFPFISDGSPCNGFMEVLDCYSRVASKVSLSGPTNFAPLIRKAVEIVETSHQYHILIIIADGQVNEEDDTISSIVEASKHPLSIVVVGVGDGPWDLMEEFDDHLPKREFDNFQFVNYHEVTNKGKHPEANLALHVMMEIPLQYRTVKHLGYLHQNGAVVNQETNVKDTSHTIESNV
ncbi:hypothetical protein FSP39_000474 [Pinctada imbricata]|uniref:VWFA domain-containing protein n=1 Tax=Pinctada imbricata TaxID=66713 RepID=A0AA88XEN1_PINIB|nr:hypothetical protein FSP39_000474 [Pinctada imbricata]